MALEHLLHETMGVPSTHYFDDFTLLAPMGLGETLSDIAKEFLDLLGWDIKKSKETRWTNNSSHWESNST